MPCLASSPGGPTPDSMRSCGVLKAPAARMTSRRAKTRRKAPGSSARLGTCPIEVAALAVFDADRAAPLVEEDAASRGRRIRRAGHAPSSHSAPARARRADDRATSTGARASGPRLEALAGAGRSGRPRRSESARSLDQPRDRCSERGGFESPSRGRPAMAPTIALTSGRSPNASTGVGHSTSSQPSQPCPVGLTRPPVSRASKRQSGRWRQFSRRSKVAPHRLGAPRRIAGQRRRSRSSPNPAGPSGSWRCARCSRRASRRAGRGRRCRPAGVDARPALCVVAEVVDPVVPRHRLVFGGEGMERRHVVVLAADPPPRVRGIGAGFEHEHAHAGLGEPRRHRPAARAGADDDVVERLALRPRPSSESLE